MHTHAYTHTDLVSENEVKGFFAESLIMKDFCHDHILGLLGVGKTILARQCNRHSWNLWRDVCPSDNHEGSEAVREWIFVVISILCGSVIDLCMDGVAYTQRVCSTKREV